MNEQEYQHYKLVRGMIIFSLQQIWPSIKVKIDNLIDQTSNTELGSENSLFLKSVIDDLEEKCVNKMIYAQWPSEKEFSDEYEKNRKSEAKLTHDVLSEVLDIYSDFFYPFIGKVKFDSTKTNYDSLPDSIKFRDYNIDLRYPEIGKPNFKKCNANHAFVLLKIDKYKTELMQGYWQVEPMVRAMRNMQEHWKRSGRAFLEKELKRHVEDPISKAETTANVFTLCSSIILLSHHFIEILQTWLDTCKLLDQKS